MKFDLHSSCLVHFPPALLGGHLITVTFFSSSPSSCCFSPDILQEPGLLQGSLLVCSARGWLLLTLHARPFADRALCWVLPLPLGHAW